MYIYKYFLKYNKNTYSLFALKIIARVYAFRCVTNVDT